MINQINPKRLLAIALIVLVMSLLVINLTSPESAGTIGILFVYFAHLIFVFCILSAFKLWMVAGTVKDLSLLYVMRRSSIIYAMYFSLLNTVCFALVSLNAISPTDYVLISLSMLAYEVYNIRKLTNIEKLHVQD